MAYRPQLGCAVASIWCAILFVAIAIFSTIDSTTDFLHFGPSNVQFAGIRINTWTRWAAVMSYSILSQFCYSIVSTTISPYISNVIRDHKTPREDKGSMMHAQFVVSIYTLYHWLSSIFDVFLWITLQLQYIVPAIVIDIGLAVIFTREYMNSKTISTLLPE